MSSPTLNISPRQSFALDCPGDYFLTTFEESDAKALHELLTLKSVRDCLILVPEPYTIEDARSWISGILISQARLLSIPTVTERFEAFFAQGSPLPLQVIRHEGKLVGAISHSNRTEGVVEMGYYLHPSHQGKGVMQAAGRKLLQYAANEFGVRKVFSSADIHNVASGKIIEKLAKETAIGEIEIGSEDLDWPIEKVVEGRERISPSTTWTWGIKPDKGWELAGDV